MKIGTSIKNIFLLAWWSKLFPIKITCELSDLSAWNILLACFISSEKVFWAIARRLMLQEFLDTPKNK
jgi:hypothetical protein